MNMRDPTRPAPGASSPDLITLPNKVSVYTIGRDFEISFY